MEKITLQRATFGPDKPVFGMLVRDGSALCNTLERPWLDNAKGESCIPPGTYRVTRYDSPSKGKVFLLHDVPGRTYIEIHVANWVHEIEGCIAVGMGLWMNGLSGSRKAMSMLLETLPEEFEIEILNPT